MQNNSHMEPREKRIQRLQKGSPIEAVETLLNSIANFFNNEIVLTVNLPHPQTSLLILGVHAAALTISEALFGKSGAEGYKLFLINFIDGDTNDTKFSQIAELIHKWRNILAHQWISESGHAVGYDYAMNHGWEQRGDTTYINPQIYCQLYLSAFSTHGKLWDYRYMFNPAEMENIKLRIITKYVSK